MSAETDDALRWSGEQDGTRLVIAARDHGFSIVLMTAVHGRGAAIVVPRELLERMARHLLDAPHAPPWHGLTT